MPLVLMTYPSNAPGYRPINRILRGVARDAGVALIDVQRDFAAVCPKEPCPDWLFLDHHPTVAGQHFIAETLVAFLNEEWRAQQGS